MPRGAPWDDPADTSLYLKGLVSPHGLGLCPRGRSREASSRLSASDLSQCQREGGPLE
jgi:hypothetical protein